MSTESTTKPGKLKKDWKPRRVSNRIVLVLQGIFVLRHLHLHSARATTRLFLLIEHTTRSLLSFYNCGKILLGKSYRQIGE
mmetsp:Transcript_1647/g.2062  ORF Transcript_1647/g.2062 Transcript_1647/m.2062 type:complete len:81 (+) Transcript_1647:1250-1492(+)